MTDDEVRRVAMLIARCVRKETEAAALKGMFVSLVKETDDPVARSGLRIQIARIDGVENAWHEASGLVSTLLATGGDLNVPK